MCFARIRELTSKFEYKFACWRGYCPTLKERNNYKIKELANKFKTNSNKETLTNVLEWQDRNIVFWSERWLLSFAFYFLLFLSVFFLLLFLRFDFPIFGWFTIGFVSSTLTIFSILVSLLKLIRKIPIRAGLRNTLAQSISIDFLIENKLGICRDYAKLTAFLLHNIYTNQNIFFPQSSNHVAAGVIIENKLYMIDQHLPIVTIDKWHKRNNADKNVAKLEGEHLEWIKLNSLLSKNTINKPNIKKLDYDMAKMLDIRESTTDTKFSELKIRWKKGAMLYEDDEIVNYSLARWLKTKVSNEMVELTHVTKLEALPDGADLVFRISLKTE